MQNPRMKHDEKSSNLWLYAYSNRVSRSQTLGAVAILMGDRARGLSEALAAEAVILTTSTRGITKRDLKRSTRALSY